jgi:hypothetical protein
MLVCCPKWRREDIRKCILSKSVTEGELIGFDSGESDTYLMLEEQLIINYACVTDMTETVVMLE